MAEASRAETRASDSAAAGSHEAATARLIGKIVRKPWITSAPINSGMPSRLSSTAIRCNRSVSSKDLMLNTLPQRPSRTSRSTESSVLSGPVTAPPPRCWTSWPIFSSSVMRSTSSAARRRSCGVTGCAPAGYSTRAANTVKMLFFIGKSLKRHAKVMKIPQKKGFGTE